MKDSFELQPNEQLILRFRKHWFVLFSRVVGIAILAAIPFIAYAWLSNAGLIPPGLRGAHVFDFLAPFWLIIIWWTLATVWTKYYLEIWTITTRRIICSVQLGLFDRDVTVWGVDRILEASVRVRNILETFLDYGELEIQTAGPSDEHERMTGVPQPGKVREIIMAQASRLGSLEEANRNQEQLLHTISHEVKSYLTKDAASLAFIAEGGDDPTQIKSFAKGALDETRKGVSAVMEILSGSNTKSGTMQLSSEVFDLRQILQELYVQFKPIAERKGLALSFSGEDGQYVMRGDKVKLRDLVFRNLVDNAIRYTTKGMVAIEIARQTGAAVCSVSDTGVGIAPEDMQRLFAPGGHGAHSKDVNPESTGFGLASAKQIVAASGGTIVAKSDGAGKGSKFVVTLPLAK